MSFKAHDSIHSIDSGIARRILNHPAQRRNLVHVTSLIEKIRACKDPKDYYEFQRELFVYIHQIEKRAGECSHSIKRIKSHKPVSSKYRRPFYDYLDLQESWELEAMVANYLMRQLRTVGDGLAWRCFGYDRRIIIALSRNQSPGPMYNKDGLEFELGTIDKLWETNGHFALLHDLTNCLRIADITEFTKNGYILHEVKTTSKKDKKQMDRMEKAINAYLKGAPLPGNDPNAYLVQVSEPYKTNLVQLRDLIQLANERGVQGMKLSQGRALVATSSEGINKHWGDNHQEAAQAVELAKQRAIKRAGINNSQLIRGSSIDTSSRSPTMAPWSIYPYDPKDCAAIICNLLVFETTVSIDFLVSSLERLGLNVKVLLPKTNNGIGDNTAILEVSKGNAEVVVGGQILYRLFYELVEPNCLAKGIEQLIHIGKSNFYEATFEPVFSNEASSWI